MPSQHPVDEQAEQQDARDRGADNDPYLVTFASSSVPLSATSVPSQYTAMQNNPTKTCSDARSERPIANAPAAAAKPRAVARVERA
jgi:hypothetical protein